MCMGNQDCTETVVADTDMGVEATALSSAKAAAVLRAKNQTFTSGKAAVAPPLAAGELSVPRMHSAKRTSGADPLKPDQ